MIEDRCVGRDHRGTHEFGELVVAESIEVSTNKTSPCESIPGFEREASLFGLALFRDALLFGLRFRWCWVDLVLFIGRPRVAALCRAQAAEVVGDRVQDYLEVRLIY